jgi:hypothetical protein
LKGKEKKASKQIPIVSIGKSKTDMGYTVLGRLGKHIFNHEAKEMENLKLTDIPSFLMPMSYRH